MTRLHVRSKKQLNFGDIIQSHAARHEWRGPAWICDVKHGHVAGIFSTNFFTPTSTDQSGGDKAIKNQSSHTLGPTMHKFYSFFLPSNM